MSTEYIAVKMGSSSTVIYKQGEGIVLSEPSMIAIARSGKTKTIKAVGTRAKRLLGRCDRGTEVVSPIFRGVIVDVEMATEMLKCFLAKIMPRTIKRPNIKCIFCVPIGVSAEELKNFEDMCIESGIGEISFIPSILCGAVGLSLPVLSANATLCLNLGGGTTDIAVISNGAIISGISMGFGGADLNTAYENIIASELHLMVSENVPEKVKIEIGSLLEHDISSVEIDGVDSISGQSRTDVVSATQLFESTKDHFDKIVVATRNIINSCPKELIADISNDGIHIFGGGAGILGIEQYFSKNLNLSVSVDESAAFIEVSGAGKLLSDNRLRKELLYNL